MTAIEDKARTLTELADRVEALSGPCRETDAEICRELGLSCGNPIIALGTDGWLVGSADNPNPVKSLRYTASMDAAMSLTVGTERVGGPSAILNQAWGNLIRMSELVDSPGLSKIEAKKYTATLARYVTAASLRSIASQVEG